MKTLMIYCLIVLFVATTKAMAQTNTKWLDSIYKVHNMPLKRGDLFVTKENDTIKLLRPKTNSYWKVKRAGKTMLVPRELIFTFRRLKQ